MADFPSQFKAVYRYDCEPAVGMCLYEPPFLNPAIHDKGPDWLDQWLVDTGYGRYRSCFRKHGITGSNLLDLTLENLNAIGVRDKGDGRGILANIEPLRGVYKHMQPEELPGLPYTHYRARYFGQQPTLDRWCTSMTNPGRAVGLDTRYPFPPDSRTLSRIRNEAGDRYEWYQRNQENHLI